MEHVLIHQPIGSNPIKLSLSYRSLGNILTLALVSKSTLLNSIFWIEHPINGAPGSFCFSGKLFKSIELIFLESLIFFPLEGVHSSFTNFPYRGMYLIASVSGIVMDVFLRILSKGEFSMFSFFLVNAFGKGIICSFPFPFTSSNSGMFSNSEVLSPISVFPILTSDFPVERRTCARKKSSQIRFNPSELKPHSSGNQVSSEI